jgi:uncharacterized protein YyaL (SSP411 family)
MERESFENDEVARILNRDFVCIKVDREERPDIDNVYMTALQVIPPGQSGGWPLSMFLTAEGKPLFGGTYWPPDDKEFEGGKVRGFKTILKIIKDAWTDKRKDVRELADQNADKTRMALEGLARGVAILDLNRDLVTAAVDEITEGFDPRYGGFGSAARGFRGTKFPMPSHLALLQSEARRDESEGPGQGAGPHGRPHARPHGARRHLRSARRRLPSLQHRAHVDGAALREDAL